MEQNEADRDELVYPDPFVIAGLWLMSATVVLQLVQIWQTSGGARPQQNPAEASIANQALGHLEQQIGDLNGFLRSLSREVEQGSPNPDAEYFDAHFRVAATRLNLAVNSAPPLQSLGQAYGRLGNVITWINQIIIMHPALAHRLGERMSDDLQGVADTLNRAMIAGSPNRVILGEGRRALQALAAAVEAELSSGRN